MSEATGVIRLDDAAIPVATTIVGLEVTGMQSGKVTKVPVSLLKGNKGDPGTALTYADLTPAQIAELQQPATDMIADVNLAISNAETATQAANDAAAQAQLDVSELTADVTQVQTDLDQLEADVRVTLNNLVVNGDFRNGTTGWIATNGTLSALNNELTHTGNSSTTGTSVISHAFNTIAAHQYYIALSAFRSHDVSNIYIEQIDGLGTIQLTNTVVNAWNFISFIKSATANSASTITLVALFTGSSNLNKLLKIKNFLSVDLTATFGAGNEPTKDEMETLMAILGSQYFEGEITLTQKQIMNWELKLIRQNRIL